MRLQVHMIGVLAASLWLGASALGQAQTPAAAQKSDPASDAVTIRFVVTVPQGTPADRQVYLSGDTPQLGGWDAEGLKLERQDDGTFGTSIQLKPGTQVQFKVTGGTWELVEKSESGGEIDNRYLIADEDKTVQMVIASWASGQAQHRPEPTLTGDIRKHENVRSANLNNERTLLVYLPPGYEDQPDRRYPVLYMHDGQNIFDAATSFAGDEWQVDEAAERLIAEGQIEPIIIVGIYNNADRMAEYVPGPPVEGRGGGKGDAYARFVVEEVKPLIDQTYRTDPAREKTGIAGSSLGGLISLHMARAYPQTFGRCAGVSPTLGWPDRGLLTRWGAGDQSWMKKTRFWIDMGTAEGRPLPGASLPSSVLNARSLAALFEQAGLEAGRDFRYLEVAEGQHNEAAWADRIDQILLFLYGR